MPKVAWYCFIEGSYEFLLMGNTALLLGLPDQPMEDSLMRAVFAFLCVALVTHNYAVLTQVKDKSSTTTHRSL